METSANVGFHVHAAVSGAKAFSRGQLADEGKMIVAKQTDIFHRITRKASRAPCSAEAFENSRSKSQQGGSGRLRDLLSQSSLDC